MSKVNMLHETEAKKCSNTGSKQVRYKMKGALIPLKVPFILLEKQRMKQPRNGGVSKCLKLKCFTKRKPRHVQTLVPNRYLVK